MGTLATHLVLARNMTGEAINLDGGFTSHRALSAPCRSFLC
jgi:hypothetical protein